MLILTATILLLLLMNHASSVPLLWTLQDVMFDDNTTATGAFVYDAEFGKYSDIAITTGQPEAYGDPFSYWINVLVRSTLATVPDAFLMDLEGQQLLLIQFESRLTDNGGNVSLYINSLNVEGTCANTDCTAASGDRLVVSGYVTADAASASPSIEPTSIPSALPTTTTMPSVSPSTAMPSASPKKSMKTKTTKKKDKIRHKHSKTSGSSSSSRRGRHL